jgi:superfamily II DNA or RNA helicase
MPNLLLHLEDFDNFREVRNFPSSEIGQSIQQAVARLDEREDLEPAFRLILADPGETPHGPVELVDIFTHTLSHSGEKGMAGFILKGKSFRTIRPADVSHQIYRLEKISGLRYAVLAAPGTILDAAKEQFCSTAERLGCYYSIFNQVDIARLLIAYGFLCPRDGQRISAGRCRCGYSPSFRILNLLQHAVLKELADAHTEQQKAGLVVLPTGSGKTRISAEDVRQRNASQVLYIGHTKEILDVAESEFTAVFGHSDVKRHRNGKSLSSTRRINIATIQLARNNLVAIRNAGYDYIVLDEVHHAAAASYRQLLEVTSPEFILGLTATPFRGDRQDILSICGNNLIANYELRSAIESGVLCPYHYFGCFDNIDYSSIGRANGRYSIRDLERHLTIPERDEAVVAKWKELAEGKPTIAFCCSHAHARRTAEAFRDAGLHAEVYLSTTAELRRRQLLKRLGDGRLTILCAVDVLNEGADIPFTECLLLLRPTESKRIFLQQLGRGLRRYVGKTHCTVIDFIGNFKNASKIPEYHGLLPFEDSEIFGLDGHSRSARELLNLPLGCKVQFDDRVVDVFAREILDLRTANRHNIGRILVLEYEKIARYLGHRPTKIEVDRNSFLDSRFFARVFGSWTNFQRVLERQ